VLENCLGRPRFARRRRGEQPPPHSSSLRTGHVLTNFEAAVDEPKRPAESGQQRYPVESLVLVENLATTCDKTLGQPDATMII